MIDENLLKSWIVRILSSENSNETLGTGFWAGNEGYIITCTHVVKDTPSLWIEYNKSKAQAQVVKQCGDVTLLHVKDMKGNSAPLSTEWQRDDIIDSIGYQYEGLQGVSYFPMKGIISGKSELEGMETITIEDAIHIKPGSSGAPAVNRRTGKVVGVISNKWESQKIGFALSLDKVITQWKVRTPRFHRVDYRQEDIFNYYNLFIGRDTEFHTIKDFLLEIGGDYFLIQGNAGMGKTALMVELAQRVKQNKFGDDVFCVCFFIRQEGGRNTPEEFLDSMNQQFMELLETTEENPVHLTGKETLYKKLLDKLASHVSEESRLLVLIDGLDESPQEGQQSLLKYLPPTVPTHAYWILTSRPLPDVLSYMPTTHSLRKARSHCLSGLGTQEVRELLLQSGDKTERSDNFINALIRHTNGEPLFLRFLCKDIASWGKKAGEFLLETPTEVKEYFRMQFKLLRERAKKPQGQIIPFEILKILLVAYSGMTAEELAGVLNAGLLDIRESIEVIERFLLGQERYELMHLEFRRTVEELLVHESEKRAIMERLLSYCAQGWQNARPKETYAIRYYLRHLWELKDYPELFSLCESGYLEKKLEWFISPEILDEDYQILFDACKKSDNLQALLHWGMHRARVSDEVVAFRDIEGLPEQIGKLAGKGMEDWWSRGVGLCALIPENSKKVKCFLGLCKGLDPVNQKVPEGIFKRIEEILKNIPSGKIKDKLTLGYVKELCRWGQTSLILAVQAARKIADDWSCSDALAAVGQAYGQLQDADAAVRILTDAVDKAKVIEDKRDRSRALVAIAHASVQLQDAETADRILTEVIQVAQKRMYSGRDALIIVAQVYGHFQDSDTAARILKEVVLDAKSNGYEGFLLNVIAAFAQISGRLQDADVAARMLTDAVQIAEGIKYRKTYLEALATVVPACGQLKNKNVADKILTEVIQTAYRMLTKEVHDAKYTGNEVSLLGVIAAFAQISGQLQDTDVAARMLTDAVQFAKEMEDKYKRSSALIAVVQICGQLKNTGTVDRILKEAIQVAQSMGYGENRSGLFAVIAQVYGQLQDSGTAARILKEAVHDAKCTGSERSLLNVIAAIAQISGQLQDTDAADKMLTDAVQIAKEIEASETRLRALTTVVQICGQLKNTKTADRILTEAVQLARWIEDDDTRSRRLAAIAQVCGWLQNTDTAVKILEEALHVTQRMGSKLTRSDTLTVIAQVYGRFDTSKAAKILTEAVDVLTQIGIEAEDAWSRRIAAIAQVCGCLQDTDTAAKVLKEVLHAARRTKSGMEYSDTLNRINQVYGRFDADTEAKILTEEVQLAKWIKDEDTRSRMVATIAWVYYGGLRDADKALRVLIQTVLQAAEEAGDEYGHRAKALAAIASVYGQLKDKNTADRILAETVWIAERIENKYYRSDAFATIVQTCRHLQNSDMVSRILTAAVQIVKESEYEFVCAKVLAAIASVYGQLKDKNTADKILAEAVCAAERIADKCFRPDASATIVRTSKHLQNSDMVSRILTAAVQDAKRIGYERGCSDAFAAIAQACGQLQDTDTAAKILKEALQVAKEIGDERDRSDVLAAIARSYILLGKISDAINLLDHITTSDGFYRITSELLEKGINISTHGLHDLCNNFLYKMLSIIARYGSKIFLETVNQILLFLGNYSAYFHSQPLRAGEIRRFTAEYHL